MEIPEQNPPAIRWSFHRLLQERTQECFAFSLSLSVLLLLSAFFLLPRLTSISVEGMVVTGGNAESTVQEMTKEVQSLEAQRSAFMQPARDPVYNALRADIAGKLSLRTLTNAVQDTAFHEQGNGVIAIDHWSFDGDAPSLTISGNVHGSGPASVTVLASFVDALQHLSFVDAVSRPSFQRVDDPVRGPVSPFDITLDLTTHGR